MIHILIDTATAQKVGFYGTHAAAVAGAQRYISDTFLCSKPGTALVWDDWTDDMLWTDDWELVIEAYEMGDYWPGCDVWQKSEEE